MTPLRERVDERVSELARRRHAARELGLPLTATWAEIEARAATTGRASQLGVRGRSFTHEVLEDVARIRATVAVPGTAIVVGDPPTARRLGAVLELSLPISPRTKKNHGRGVAKEAAAYVRYAHAVKALVGPFAAQLGLPLPDLGYNCAARFVVDTEAADTVGLMQGVADALQDAGVISNDRLLRTWDGTHQVYDPLRPLLAIRLTPNTMSGAVG